MQWRSRWHRFKRIPLCQQTLKTQLPRAAKQAKTGNVPHYDSFFPSLPPRSDLARCATHYAMHHAFWGKAPWHTNAAENRKEKQLSTLQCKWVLPTPTHSELQLLCRTNSASSAIVAPSRHPWRRKGREKSPFFCLSGRLVRAIKMHSGWNVNEIYEFSFGDHFSHLEAVLGWMGKILRVKCEFPRSILFHRVKVCLLVKLCVSN